MAHPDQVSNDAHTIEREMIELYRMKSQPPSLMGGDGQSSVDRGDKPCFCTSNDASGGPQGEHMRAIALAQISGYSWGKEVLVIVADELWYHTGASKPQPTGPFVITPDAAALHKCARINEDVRIPIGNNIDGVSNDKIMEAVRNTYERTAYEMPAVGRMQEQEDTFDKHLKRVMAPFSAAASCTWAALPVLEKALGPKLVPYAYGAACVPVALLGASAFGALVHKKSPRHKVFAKYGKLVFIAVTVALPIMVLPSMIVG